MTIEHRDIGVCGLSCRLCPNFNTDAASRCPGCKSDYRMGAGCPFVTCALKKKGVEFCWDCAECDSCGKWAAHREAGRRADSFKCYQRLDADIATARERGLPALVAEQDQRHALLRAMLDEWNDGRSKSYYCIACTVMSVPELERALALAGADAGGFDAKARAKRLRAVLDGIAADRGYELRLRK